MSKICRTSEQLLAHVETVLADQPGQQGAHRAGDGGDSASAAYYLCRNHPQLRRCPQVRIQLIDSSVGNVIEAVSSGQADFGLCFAKTCQPVSNSPLLPTTARGRLSARFIRWRAQHAPEAGRRIFERDYIGLDRVPGNRTLLDRELAHLTRRGQVSAKPATSPRCFGDGGSGHRHCRRARDVDARREHSVPRCAAHRPGGHAYGGLIRLQRPYSVRGSRARS